MKLQKSQWFLVFFNLAYILAFLAYYVSIRDYEFLWYIGVLVFFFALILLTLNKSKFDALILWGLSIWGFLHMAGGGISVGDSVLYAYQVLPIISSGEYTILKFDQIVHFYGFAVATLLAYHLIKPHLKESQKRKAVYFVVIMAGAGLGVINEIVEFVAVIVFPETGVGGYVNTSLDLVSNMLGAMVAGIYIHVSNR